jgi:hypothetical protein
MIDPEVKQFVEGTMTKAKRLGIVQPVFTRLMPGSLPARAIYARVKGRPMRRPSRKQKKETIDVLLSVSDAARLFRVHGGIVGAGVAALMSRSETMVDCWLATLDEHQLYVVGFHENEVMLTSSGYYCAFTVGLLLDSARDYRGLCTVPMVFEDGAKVLVCGHSLREVGGTVGLVSAVVDGCLPPCEDSYKLVPLPVDDDVLAVILQQHFVAVPQAVAEAIRVLRKRGKEEERWLMRVLESQPELKALARAVQHHLSGE